MKLYELCVITESNEVIKGGIPTSKSHAQRWANISQKNDPESKYSVCEYDGRPLDDDDD